MNKERFEAFSDGVYAFAITLLILGIVLPSLPDHPKDDELIHALVGLWPNTLAYALSFAVIGTMWQNHHAVFRTVARVDRRSIFLNLLLLAGTVFIPFATSTLGSYPTLHAAAFLYGLVLLYCATIYNLLLEHLIRSRAFKAEITPETIAATRHAYRVGWCSYLLAMLLALVFPLASFAAYIAIVLYFLIPSGVDDDLGDEE
jgi:uncharacterized membrane protein